MSQLISGCALATDSNKYKVLLKPLDTEFFEKTYANVANIVTHAGRPERALVRKHPVR